MHGIMKILVTEALLTREDELRKRGESAERIGLKQSVEETAEEAWVRRLLNFRMGS